MERSSVTANTSGGVSSPQKRRYAVLGSAGIRIRVLSTASNQVGQEPAGREWLRGRLLEPLDRRAGQRRPGPGDLLRQLLTLGHRDQLAGRSRRRQVLVVERRPLPQDRAASHGVGSGFSWPATQCGVAHPRAPKSSPGAR